MADVEIQKIRDRRIELLCRNLDHVSNAYYAAESVFPFWDVLNYWIYFTFYKGSE
jgi:hypothetical protein